MSIRRFTYPDAPRGDVVAHFHGTPVPDPYRWLEDPAAPETVAWVEAQNALSRSFLDAVPRRAAIRDRLTELWNFPRHLTPTRKGDRYFYQKNDGLQNQPVLYMLASLDGEPSVVLDPNTFSPDGTVALTNLSFTDDGRLLAYLTSAGGSDWQTIHLYDVDAGRDLDDVIEWVKFAGVAWKPDNSGFYYNRHILDGEVPPTETPSFTQVYYHALGTPQSADVRVFGGSDPGPAMASTPYASEDGQYLLIDLFDSFIHNRVAFRPMDSDGPFFPLIEEDEGLFSYVGSVGSLFYFQTTLGTPRGRIIALDANQPGRDGWREIIPEGEDVLAPPTMFPTALLAHDRIVATYMHHAHYQVRVFERDGAPVSEIPLPAPGAISGMSSRRQDAEMFLAFESFLYPLTIFRYDFTSGALQPFHPPELAFDRDRYQTAQVFYTSRDGTRIPMFVTHRADLALDGSHPVLLYGYGGFSISLTPVFSVFALVWMEMGGIFAQPNLRGGAEYGEEWHHAGMLDRKQNVFDDFIAAGEYLVSAGYTRPEKLAIYGGSNGGLLVSACMVQRPDLFGAVVCRVPVADMLRYQHFTAGRYWVSEYGDADTDPEAFRYLMAYSPLHNVQPDATYPPILTLTAEGDDRVVPMHAAKLTAALQAADTGHNPILLFHETKAGHGAGKPISKQIDMYADILGFLVRTLDMA
jgi:prolyl oligopeptidase